MIKLTKEAEALAQRIADAKGISIEDAIYVALEDKTRFEDLASGYCRPRDQSADAIADRRARTDRFLASLDAMPVLDSRSPREIMDNLNPL